MITNSIISNMTVTLPTKLTTSGRPPITWPSVPSKGAHLAIGHASGVVEVHCTLTRTLSALYYPPTLSSSDHQKVRCQAAKQDVAFALANHPNFNHDLAAAVLKQHPGPVDIWMNRSESSVKTVIG